MGQFAGLVKSSWNWGVEPRVEENWRQVGNGLVMHTSLLDQGRGCVCLRDPPLAPSTESRWRKQRDFCVGQDVAWVWEGSEVTAADHRKWVRGEQRWRGPGQDRMSLRLWNLSLSAEVAHSPPWLPILCHCFPQFWHHAWYIQDGNMCSNGIGKRILGNRIVGLRAKSCI